MSLLLNGDCLEQLNSVDDNSVDFIFCDLPYGQTSCKWDIIVPWEPFWKEIMRVKKLNTPVFFTTTTKFGVQLINSAPKKMPFRYDLVWVKSAPAGFLSAKKMPMRKHEMVYAFYEKLPFYDLSSHKHKFIKQEPVKEKNGVINNDNMYRGGKGKQLKDMGNQSFGESGACYDPPLPTSVVKEEDKGCYGEKVPNSEAKYGQKCARQYDPPLPTSVVKEESYDNGNRKGGFGGEQKGLGTIYQDPALISSQDVHKKNGLKSLGYDPPLPTSVVKEEDKSKMVVPNSDTYGKVPREQSREMGGCQVRYDPPLPVSVVKEEDKYSNGTINSKTYDIPNKSKGGMYRSPAGQYDPPLPTSVVKEEGSINNYKAKRIIYTDENGNKIKEGQSGADQTKYDPPLPTTMLEIKSTRGKHSTEKPVALMEWLLKYYSKEGDTVLDPTMGSGSTGVACKNMKRNFIGIEKDPDIYQVAVNRIED